MLNPPDKTLRPSGRVLLTGASGMVGSSVLAALLNEQTTREVVSLGRRPSGKDHAEPDTGIAQYRPGKGNRKPRFSSDESLALGRCPGEIGESLEYARGLISAQGPQDRVHAVLKTAKKRNRFAGSHVGLSPDSATAQALIRFALTSVGRGF